MLYVGIIKNLERRIHEHKQKLVKGFTSKYYVNKLVHAEQFSDINEAICREKCIKKWNRGWKVRLIEEHNLLDPRLRGDDTNFRGMTLISVG